MWFRGLYVRSSRFLYSPFSSESIFLNFFLLFFNFFWMCQRMFNSSIGNIYPRATEDVPLRIIADSRDPCVVGTPVATLISSVTLCCFYQYWYILCLLKKKQKPWQTTYGSEKCNHIYIAELGIIFRKGELIYFYYYLNKVKKYIILHLNCNL